MRYVTGGRAGMSISASVAIGMAIFVVTIGTAFLLVQGALYPSDMFGDEVGDAADRAGEQVRTEAWWTIQRAPISSSVDAAATGVPIDTRVPVPDTVDADTVAAVAGGRSVPVQYNATTGDTVFVADRTAGPTRFDLTYTHDADLPPVSYNTSVDSDGTAVWNQVLNASFTDAGVTSLTYNGSPVLGGTADIGATAEPAITVDTVEATATYNSTVTDLYDRSQWLVLETTDTDTDWVFPFHDRYATLYADGQTYSLDQSGTIYANATDFIDLYDADDGVAVMGQDLFVNVSRESTDDPVDITVTLPDTDSTRLAVYPHDGDYTDARPHNQVFQREALTVGIPEPVSGVSRAAVTDLAAEGYDTLRERLGIPRMQVNISVSGVASMGRPVTTTGDVAVIEQPVPVVDRFGNTSIHTLQIRVWNR